MIAVTLVLALGLDLLLLLLGACSGSSLAGFGTGSSSDIFILISSYLGRGQPLYLALYAAMIIFFGFFLYINCFQSR